jgi:hypothetical protein
MEPCSLWSSTKPLCSELGRKLRPLLACRGHFPHRILRRSMRFQGLTPPYMTAAPASCAHRPPPACLGPLHQATREDRSKRCIFAGPRRPRAPGGAAHARADPASATRTARARRPGISHGCHKRCHRNACRCGKCRRPSAMPRYVCCEYIFYGYRVYTDRCVRTYEPVRSNIRTGAGRHPFAWQGRGQTSSTPRSTRRRPSLCSERVRAISSASAR